MDWMTVKDTSEKWGLSARRITTLCTAGRIPGAVKMNRSWLIPKSAQKPADSRVKSGKYVGVYQKYRK